jgi:sensor histidine kinase regulating citrate/malate metabolism
MNTENVPCVNSNSKDGLIIESEVIKHIREQRHDFMNHIQVVWGYLQLKKPDEAIRYIARINEEFNVLGSLFKISCPQLSLFLYIIILME